jgi:hypothetical protein
MTQIESFSSGYLLVDADTVEYGGENVAVPHDMLDNLYKHTKLPYLKLGTEHFIPQPEWGIPSATVAIPSDEDVEPNGKVLLTKTEAAMQVAAAKEELH